MINWRQLERWKTSVVGRRDARFAASDLLAGGLSAIVMLSYASSFATLIFGGSLAPHVNLVVVAALVSTIITVLVLSWRSSFHFELGGPDSNPSAILAVTVAAIAADLTLEGNGAEILPTVLMYLYVSAIGCGLLLAFVGERHWGRFVRFIPHPVLGGFLAGGGILLVGGSWKMLVGASPLASTLAQVERVPMLAWIFAGAVGLLLTVLMRTWRHFSVIPGVILSGIVLFHLVLWWRGIDLETARAQNLLLQPVKLGAWANPFNQPWPLVRWDLILQHAYDFVALTTVVLVSILLNATSIDYAVGRDANFDRELKALGFANILSGTAGGLVVINSFSRSMLNLRAGAKSPWAARTCVALMALLLLAAPQAVGWLPKPVLVGLILYLGIALLLQWLWDARREMLKSDYVIVLAILGTVMAFGIVPGVMVGLLASMASFVLNISRSSVIKDRFTSATRQSNVERPSADIAWLRNHGEQLQGATLQGYLFFGTSSTLLDELRKPLQKAKILTLDFWNVRGIDASSVIILRRLLKLAVDSGVEVVFTGLSSRLQARLASCGFDLARNPVHVFEDLDHGLEWAEETLLQEARRSITLGDFLGVLDPADVTIVEGFFETLAVKEGETFIHSGEPSDRFFVVLEGRVSIHLQAAATGYRKRLRTYGAGTIVGEMGMYNDEPRSADISADIDTRLAGISRTSITMLEQRHPHLASRLHRLVVLTLATRLRTANSAIRELL